MATFNRSILMIALMDHLRNGFRQKEAAGLKISGFALSLTTTAKSSNGKERPDRILRVSVLDNKGRQTVNDTGFVDFLFCYRNPNMMYHAPAWGKRKAMNLPQIRQFAGDSQ